MYIYIYIYLSNILEVDLAFRAENISPKNVPRAYLSQTRA